MKVTTGPGYWMYEISGALRPAVKDAMHECRSRRGFRTTQAFAIELSSDMGIPISEQ